MRVTLDADFRDDIIIFAPHEFLSPEQIRELQNVLEKREIIVLPPGRIICEETLTETLSQRDPERL